MSSKGEYLTLTDIIFKNIVFFLHDVNSNQRNLKPKALLGMFSYGVQWENLLSKKMSVLHTL